MDSLYYPYVIGSDAPIPNLFDEIARRSKRYDITIFANSPSPILDQANVREVYVPPEEKIWSRRVRLGITSLRNYDLIHTGGRGRRHYKVSKITHFRNRNLRQVHTLRADIDPDSDIGPTELKRKLVDIADVVTAVSHHTAATAEEHLGVNPRVIYNGVDPDEFHPDQPEPSKFDQLEIKQPVALFVGAFQRRKNPSDIVEIAKKLPHVTFILIGDGPRFETIKTRSDALENVVLTGRLPKSQLPPIYAHATVFLFPSIREGCPNVVLEAMASGLPVVGYSATSMPELVDQGETGYLVETGDIKALAEAVDKCVGSDDKMGAAAREYAIENHSFELIAKQYHDVYRELL